MPVSNPVQLVLQVLRERHGQLTEADAAALLQLSPVRFRHIFKRDAQMSFRSARLRAKLSYGAHLLRTTDLAIPEVSDRLGYAERCKFEKAFKAVYAITPTGFRAREADGQSLQIA